jgi:large subunit ribosomal protein L4
MKADVTTLDAGTAGSVQLSKEIFGLEPRTDLLHRMVTYQLANQRQGTHQSQTRGEVSKHNQRIGKQKGGGGARHGNGSVGQFRGGAKAFGPRSRDHSIKLPKKVRALALKHALSSKKVEGQLVILEDAKMKAPKTQELRDSIAKLGWKNALVVGGSELDENFALASRNITSMDVLPAQGINVYDILRHETLVLTKEAVDQIEARLK